MKSLDLTWWCICAFLLAVILWSGETRAETRVIYSFIPATLKTCDGWRKPHKDEFVLTATWPQSKWPFQYQSICVWQKITWR